MTSPANSVLLLTDPAMERHPALDGHPERPARLAAVAEGVVVGAERSGARLTSEAPAPAADRELLRVHTAAHLDLLRRLTDEGGAWLDPDTILGRESLAAARIASGAAIRAAHAAADGEASVAFAVVRPPGHHAARARAAGFCLINHVAVAAEALRAERTTRRLAIVDWDVHHGDGTQEIYDADPDLCYASTHESGIYPGTGAVEEAGRGAATGTKHNRPLAAGDGDDAFIGAWTGLLLPAIEAFRPEAVLVSAGYDAHRDDPLAWLEVTDRGYRAVAEELGALAARLGLTGIAVVLEGGYDLDALRDGAAASVEGLLAGLKRGALAADRT